jgi:hypothetical protein
MTTVNLADCSIKVEHDNPQMEVTLTPQLHHARLGLQEHRRPPTHLHRTATNLGGKIRPLQPQHTYPAVVSETDTKVAAAAYHH